MQGALTLQRSLANPAFYKGGKVNENGSSMDVDMVAKCLHMSRSCAEIRSCISYLKTNILAKGIELTRDAQQTSHEFYVHMQEYYTRFCMDVIDVAMIVGIVPYILVKNGKGYGYPMVLKPDAGVVKVTYSDNGSAKYSFSFNNSDTNRSRVFFEVFNDIGRNGEVCSVLSTLVPAYDFIQSQELNTFMANEVNARPPVFLTTGDNAFTEKDVVNRDVYGDGIIAEQEFQSQMMRNRIQLNVVQAQKTYLKYMNLDGNATPDFFGATRDRLSGYPIVDYTQGTSFQPEYVPLPSNCAPANPTMPRAPEALQQNRLHFQMIVCMAFSIPLSILSGTMSNAVTSSASESMSESLNHTFEFTKNKLANMCLKAYRLLHEDMSPDVRVVFPSMINVGMYDKLYKDGLLTYEAYKEQLSKTYGIPLGAFEKTPRIPIEEETKRQMASSRAEAPPPKKARLELDAKKANKKEIGDDDEEKDEKEKKDTKKNEKDDKKKRDETKN